MLKSQVIGLGAAGNKAVAELIKQECISQDRCMIINTNTKDMPPAFRESGGKVAEIGNGIGGCGQERSKGREVALAALQDGSMGLDQFLDLDSNLVVLITSTEGGTGSGATPIVAQYIKEVHNINVLIFAITGFEQAPRAIWNTIEFFKEMKDSYHIEILRNKKFLADNRNNQLKAEVAANKELCARYKVLVGSELIDSVQNIDDRDLIKLTTEVGWGNVEVRVIEEKLKNTSQFNDILADMIDETKSFDVSEGTQKRLGIVVSLPQKEHVAIDYNLDEIISKYGEPFEIYKHIQDASQQDVPRFIAFISVGMKLPIEELEILYNEAKNKTARVDNSEDDFFNKVSSFKQEDNAFDFKEDTRTTEQRAAEAKKAKNNFFAQFGSKGASAPEAPKATNVRESGKKEDFSNY